ncbi:protein amnionless [Nothobranchius furzeri]|uniref:Protein amnionless n=1 Tax=Nothobranchius furzeri TaxID=105023 RepID=A0A9D2XHD4_NOTFU|nr:protein amnionless [Nothobranchius furzeri]KAF7202206.1 amnion associated transmembrane protein [Nothobranchius furzeri]
MVTQLESKVTQSSQCLSETLKMLRTQVLLLFCLARATNAIYKQWIPDTNYENKTNWDKGDVPCGNDRVHFSSQSKVSVFVETMHAVQEILLPINGEFILNPGAGFYVVSGQDPSCGGGVTTNFKDSDSLQWFNPALWQTAATQNDLHQGNFLFSVHEESVPCQNDEVIFKALSSFRSDTSCSQSTIPVKSVSVLGKTFDDRSEFSRYLSSHSGQLQFHGSSAVTVGNPSCEDSTGCVCENSVHHQLICSTVTCASLSCKNPLLPVGHCCEVCGAIITIDYAENFNLQHYRDRIRHLFLILPQYKSIQLGMSKVLKPRPLMRLIPFGTSREIQVVIVDGDMGKLSNTLAQDIIKDAKSHGSELGITKAEIQGSTESNSAMVVGVVFAVLLMIAFIVILVVLNRKGVVQMPAMPSMPSLSLFRRSPDVEDINGDIDCGFDNPMFDGCDMPSALPGLYDSNAISLTRTGVHFINPVYDEHETDFTV